MGLSEDDNFKITARDIILQPFMKGDEEPLPSADKNEEVARHHGIYYFKITNIFIAINAYLSTPKFIMTLTDLSLELISQPDRKDFL
jgi:hypothetical protein